MKLIKYLDLNQETGKITIKSAVEKINDPIISFNDVWVIVYETAQDILRTNKVLLSINLIKKCASKNEVTDKTPSTLSTTTIETTTAGSVSSVVVSMVVVDNVEGVL